MTSDLESVAMAHGQLQQHHHALVLPFPLQGHISPLLQLSQHLASCHGFRITFVNTEYNHARIFMQQQVEAPMENSSSRKYNSNISMVGVSDGLPMEAERGALGLRRVVASMAVCARPRLEQLISEQESSNAITCIITDLYMLSWARDLAKSCDIPAVIAFNASSIAQFSFLYHIPFLLSSGQLNPDGTLTDVNQQQRLSGIPGVVDIPFLSVPWLNGVDEDRNESIFCGLASMYDSVLDQLDCILFNSFTEMEKEALEALVKETGVKMAPVGPMILLDSSTTANGESLAIVGINSTGSQRELDERAGGCLEWLEGRAKHSVLYIAFGTTAWLRREDLNALARGIEASEVAFLWVVRQELVRQYGSDDQTSCTDASAASVDHILPGDFLERTKGRAYFTSWAPQTRVLSHPAIGAFLTHGGWNSMLEAISNGVPMLLWPDFWDQKFHTEQAVEQWKVGLRVRNIHSYCAVCKELLKIDKELNIVMHDHELQADAPLQLYDAADEQLVERLVRTVMSGEEGKQMRQRAAALSSKARLAMHGSSHNNLQDVIRFLDAKIGALKPCP